MRDLLEQIERASEAGLYYVALIGALTVPDMCGALGSQNGRASGPKYRDWLVTAMGVSPAEAASTYGFRCSLLHQGSAHPEGSEYPIAFTEPGGPQFHNVATRVNGELVRWVSVPIFVTDVLDAARRWLDAYEQTSLVQRNMDRFVRRRPEGLPPHVTGAAVIA